MWKPSPSYFVQRVDLFWWADRVNLLYKESPLNKFSELGLSAVLDRWWVFPWSSEPPRGGPAGLGTTIPTAPGKAAGASERVGGAAPTRFGIPFLFGFSVARRIMPGYLLLLFHEQNTSLNGKKESFEWAIVFTISSVLCHGCRGNLQLIHFKAHGSVVRPGCCWQLPVCFGTEKAKYMAHIHTLRVCSGGPHPDALLVPTSKLC